MAVYINHKEYEFIEEIVQEVLVNKEEKAQSTDKADRILTHPIFGIPIFLGIMALVFLLTFTVGDFISGYFELAVEWLSGFISNALAAWQVNPAVTSLLVDGIIAGVGGILTFLPNIFILFLAIFHVWHKFCTKTVLTGTTLRFSLSLYYATI